MLLCFLILADYTGVEGGQATLLVAQVGGFNRRLDSPRLGLSTVRRAQAATPVIRTKREGTLWHPFSFIIIVVK